MSHPANEAFVESLYATFRVAIDAGDWETAHNAMAEMRDGGFEAQWQQMFDEYNHERFADA